MPGDRKKVTNTRQNIQREQVDQSEISKIPNELMIYGFSFLGQNDLRTVSQANKRLSYLAGDEQLWKRLIVKDFGLDNDNLEILKYWLEHCLSYDSDFISNLSYKTFYRYLKFYKKLKEEIKSEFSDAIQEENFSDYWFDLDLHLETIKKSALNKIKGFEAVENHVEFLASGDSVYPLLPLLKNLSFVEAKNRYIAFQDVMLTTIAYDRDRLFRKMAEFVERGLHLSDIMNSYNKCADKSKFISMLEYVDKLVMKRSSFPFKDILNAFSVLDIEDKRMLFDFSEFDVRQEINPILYWWNDVTYESSVENNQDGDIDYLACYEEKKPLTLMQLAMIFRLTRNETMTIFVKDDAEIINNFIKHLKNEDWFIEQDHDCFMAFLEAAETAYQQTEVGEKFCLNKSSCQTFFNKYREEKYQKVVEFLSKYFEFAWNPEEQNVEQAAKIPRLS